MTITFYKLQLKTDPTQFYIGSTTVPLPRRKSQHAYAATQFKHRKLYSRVNTCINGIDDFEAIDLKEKTAEGQTMREKEQDLINLYKPTLNANRAYIGEEDRHKLQLVYWKRRNQRAYPCACGCIIKGGGRWRHFQSIKHNRLLYNKCLEEMAKIIL